MIDAEERELVEALRGIPRREISLLKGIAHTKLRQRLSAFRRLSPQQQMNRKNLVALCAIGWLVVLLAGLTLVTAGTAVMIYSGSVWMGWGEATARLLLATLVLLTAVGVGITILYQYSWLKWLERRLAAHRREHKGRR
jgi:hypothetical protein